jgi:nucleoside-diphosphate-sugar epimerase
MDTIFHLAALIGIPYSYVAPAHYVETNVGGTLAVLEAARAAGTRRLVVTSTSETFGSAQYVPMDEKHPLNAQSPYAATKVAADQLALSYQRSFGTPVVILRPFNTFGPRQSTRAVIPTIINQLLAGPAVRLGSLDTIRDMNPVPNTVDGFLLTAECEGIEGQTFVVGSGEGRSIESIANAVAERLGVVPEVAREEGRIRPAASEVDRLVCDYGLASEVLGYEPRVSFGEGLDQAIEYYRRNRLAGTYAI